MIILLLTFLSALGTQDAFFEESKTDLPEGSVILDDSDPVVEYRKNFVAKYRVPHSMFAPRELPFSRSETEIAHHEPERVSRVAHSPVVRPPELATTETGEAAAQAPGETQLAEEPVIELHESERVARVSHSPVVRPSDLAKNAGEAPENQLVEEPVIAHHESEMVAGVAHSPVVKPSELSNTDETAGRAPDAIFDQESVDIQVASPSKPGSSSNSGSSFMDRYLDSWKASKPDFQNPAECPQREPQHTPTLLAKCTGLPVGLTCFYGEECCCGQCRPLLKTTCTSGLIWRIKQTNHCDSCVSAVAGEKKLQCKFRGQIFDQGQEVKDDFVCRKCTCGGDPANPTEMKCEATCKLRNPKFCWKYCSSDNLRSAACYYYCKRI